MALGLRAFTSWICIAFTVRLVECFHSMIHDIPQEVVNQTSRTSSKLRSCQAFNSTLHALVDALMRYQCPQGFHSVPVWWMGALALLRLLNSVQHSQFNGNPFEIFAFNPPQSKASQVNLPNPEGCARLCQVVAARVSCAGSGVVTRRHPGLCRIATPGEYVDRALRKSHDVAVHDRHCQPWERGPRRS
jgi:hypothetical protein